MDIVNEKTRSYMMSQIRSKNTKPELIIRKALFARGYRYKIHDKKLPGKPDIVLPKYNTVIFVNGCFWHGHNCHLFRIPKTRTEFWKDKIEGNILRDKRNKELLANSGWKVIEVWECSIKGKNIEHLESVINDIVLKLNE